MPKKQQFRIPQIKRNATIRFYKGDELQSGKVTNLEIERRSQKITLTVHTIEGEISITLDRKWEKRGQGAVTSSGDTFTCYARTKKVPNPNTVEDNIHTVLVPRN